MSIRCIAIGLLSIGAYSVMTGVAFAATIETVVWGSDHERIIDTAVVGEQIFLSELVGHPQQYVVVFDATSTLHIQVRTVPLSDILPDLSLLIIKDAPLRGVETVARLHARDTEWTEEFDPQIRIHYLSGQLFSQVVGPGTYRIEVSTPINVGRYELRFGNDEVGGWGQSLVQMRTLQRWYAVPWWQGLLSSLVYVPVLGMSIMVGIIYYVSRRYRARVS